MTGEPYEQRSLVSYSPGSLKDNRVTNLIKATLKLGIKLISSISMKRKILKGKWLYFFIFQIQREMIFKNWSFLLELSNSWAQWESSDVIIQISHQVWCENFGNTSKNRSRNMFDFGLFFQFKIHSFDYSPVTSVCDTLGLSLLHVSKGMQRQYTTGLEGALPASPRASSVRLCT